jgi:hypothetical protein
MFSLIKFQWKEKLKNLNANWQIELTSVAWQLLQHLTTEIWAV